MANKRQVAAALAAILALSATIGCDRAKGSETRQESDSHASGGTQANPTGASTGNAAETAAPETAPAIADVQTPTEGHYEASGETTIRLGDTIEIRGEGATAAGTVVTVTRAGSYLVSGIMADGQIVVDTQDEGKVTLIFNGASLASASGPAIFVKSAPKKVVLYTAEGSVNLLSDGTGYVVPDEEQVEGSIYPNACVYACDDLELDGAGELRINGHADKGINTKDDLKIRGGTVIVTATGVGIRANDSLEMSGGTVTVTSGGDGVKTANTETEGKGHIVITGGALYITAQGDGLSAATDLTVGGGTLVITTTDENGEVLKESTGNPASSSSMDSGRPGGFGGGGRPGMPGESTSNKASISAKGLKAAGNLTVSGGKLTIVAQDDGLHSDGNITVSGGTLHIRTADDGMHAEKELLISGGVTEVAQSYEGLEALHITVTGGTNRITATDDGANATSGEGGGFGGPGGGRPGMGNWGSSGSIEFSEDQPCLTFAGGYTVFNAAGDGIDSNGWIKMTGGTVLVYGPTDNGNGPIDTGDGGYNMTISGGTFLAVGSSGMAETAESNGQAVLTAYWNRTGLSAGDTIGIVNADGRVMAAFELPKSIASMVFSSAELVAGQSYTIVSGGSFEGTATDGVIDPATYTGYTSLGEIEVN